MPITRKTPVSVGQKVSYEDMANPLRVGRIADIRSQVWGDQYVITFEDGEMHYTDLRQHGWKLVSA